MRITKIILKTISLILVISFLMSFVIPVIINASSYADSANKLVLNTVEDIEKYVDDSKYPGYKSKLIALKKANPTWKFTIYYTGIEWKRAIYNETKGLHSRSLVQNKTGEWLCEECGTKVYDWGGWMCASEKAVAYFMDSRNYLTTNYIFQFEELSYNSDTYTIDGIEKVLNGTFMYNKNMREYYNNNEIEDITFAKAIMNAANASGVSPYYLASRIRQEIGINGSDSIYGTYKGYEGYYNFYNIGANSGVDPIGNGLDYAANTTIGKYLLPWNDPVKAIKGGAIWIATNYIAAGQDTLYFQKFDVVSNGTSLYTHQYMQNIFAARNEGYTVYSTYNKLGLLDNNYNFIIPLYENMPSELSKEPLDKTVTTVEEKVQVTGDRVIVRKSPTTSGVILTILSKGTILTRIEKNVAYANGYNWDKVKLTNGIIGYMATNYLSNVISSSTEQNTNNNSEEKAYVSENNVNVRKNPGTSSAKITKLSNGTMVTVLEKNVAYKNGYYWDKIRLSNGTIGYIASKYLSSTANTNYSSTSSSEEKVKVTENNVNVRKSPGTSSTRITRLSKGTVVTRISKSVAYKNGYYWDIVKLSNGKIGYIASKYLKNI